MKISLIVPSRNNLKYLKWSYAAARKNQGNHTVEYCVADDFSNDGTWEWCQEMMTADSDFKAIRNDGPTRLGHTILYDRLVNEVASHDVCMIYHADMYLCPGALDAI
jgi:glycosyltransferase involved in cell wall biosynthesis